MHDKLRKTIFTVYFNEIVLFCFLKSNIVIASRLIGNSFMASNVKYIDNEGEDENNERLKKFPIVENVIDDYMGNNTFFYYNDSESVFIDYYLENTKLKLNIYDQKQNATSHSRKGIDIRIHRQTTRLRIHRLLKLVKIWFLVYLALAIPLWCAKGWCCCCLLCKCFKPNKIIEEAKVFLETNPPGVFQHRGGLIYYEPSENERDCYEKLEHLIRTI